MSFYTLVFFSMIVFSNLKSTLNRNIFGTESGGIDKPIFIALIILEIFQPLAITSLPYSVVTMSDNPYALFDPTLNWKIRLLWQTLKAFCSNYITIESNIVFMITQSKPKYLTLQASTPQNGQTHSNNSPANCQGIVWVCLTILWGWRLKGYVSWKEMLNKLDIARI